MTGDSQLFRGYIETRGKRAFEKFKDREDLRPYEQVRALPEFAGVLAADTVLIDVDDADQAEVLMRLVEAEQLDCQVVQTTRGKHFFFKNREGHVAKSFTGARLACGVVADIKVGPNAYAVRKVDGKERFDEWDIEEGGEYQELPAFLRPVKNAPDFLHMEAGQRNQKLFNYILTLQAAGFTVEECRETIRIINAHILPQPLPHEEVETILRDEAFRQVPSYGTGQMFRHDRAGEDLIRDLNVRRIDGVVHTYQGGVYVAGERPLHVAIRERVPGITRSRKLDVIDYCRDMAPDAYRSAPELLCFRNGVLDVRTMELHAHGPQFVLTAMLGASWDPEAYDALAERTLDSVTCGGASVGALLEEIIGYCLYPSARFHKAAIFTGSGANGKSTILHVIRALLGPENVSSLDLASLGDRFAKAELHHKLANIGDDIGDEFVADSSLFKKVVSGDAITAERKGQDLFSFEPYATLIFAANDLPRIADRTGAVLRRLLIVPFEATYTHEDPDYCPDIVERLTTPEALSYLARLAVEGLRRLMERKCFTEPERVRKELEDYSLFNQPVRGFVAEFGGLEYVCSVPSNEVYRAYQSYCLDNGYHAESHNRFGRTLRSLYGLESYPRSVNGRLTRYYRPETDDFSGMELPRFR